MNIFSIISFILAIVVLVTGLFLASSDIRIFLDYPSLFIVFGGTFAATSISFQINRIFRLFKIFLQRIILGKKFDYVPVIEEVMKIGEEFRKGANIRSLVSKANDPFLAECINLYAENVLEKEEFLDIIEERADRTLRSEIEEANKIKTIAKFPPAFGMMGTTIGMIVLLGNLGGENALKMIGPAMGVCLITTLYGVIVANLAMVPIAENLTDGAKENHLKNQIVVEGMRLMTDKANPILIGIRLNSFLKVEERVDWKKVLGK